MIELYKPDMYKKSIYEIDYKKLKNYGIKCILFDLDNTLVSYKLKNPSRKLKDLIEQIKKMGFKVIIMSNSGKKRLSPFKNKLVVDCCADAFKPFAKKFIKIFNIYGYKESEVCIIGDQIPTDIYGGNKVGIYSVLVDRISSSEPFWTKINRIREKRIINKLSKRGLFKKGVYYE